MSDGVVISSDSHVFEPPDLWSNRIDAKFRDRAPQIKRVGDVDHLVVEGDQTIAGIGLLINAGARFDAPESISHHGRLEDVHVGGYDPDQHIKDMKIDGVSAEVLYPSQCLFYYKIADSELTSAVFRAYNDWLADFCQTNPERLKGVAVLNVDDVQDGINELERSAKKGLVGGMITEYPGEGRRYDNPEYEPLWAAAQDLNMPLSLHTGTRRGRDLYGRALGDAVRSVRDATARTTKVFYPAASMCDMIFAGVFERYPGLKVAIVEFELSWAPYVLTSMDYTYEERVEEALYRFKGDALPSDFFHSNIYLSFQEDDVGIRLRDVIGVDRLMWGSDYPHPESTFPKSREILDRILEGVPQDERDKIVGANVARLYGFDIERIA